MIDLSNPLFYAAVLLLLVALLMLTFYGLIQWNKYLVKKGSHPVVLQFLNQAIVLAYKSSDSVFDQIGERLHSVQKIEVAGAVYDILPNCFTISILAVKMNICWKDKISKDQFIVLVAAQFDKLVEQYGTLRTVILQKMLDEMGQPPLITPVV